MRYISSNRFYGFRSTRFSYRNEGSLRNYRKISKSTTLKNNVLKDTRDDSIGNIINRINSINSILAGYRDISYSKLAKYKSNDNNFENAIKRLYSHYEPKSSKLSAKDSTLDLNNNSSLTIKTKSGKTVTLACDNGTVYMPGDIDKLSSSDIKEVEDIGHLLTYLNHDSSGILASRSFSESSIKSMLTKVGIKPGFFDLKTSGGSNKFLMLDNGSIYSEHQVEAERSYYNKTDLIKNAGFTKNATILIDGKEYKISEDGHFNIPKGARCVAENMIIKK